MNPTPWQTIAAFAQRRVLVIGEAMLDRYICGTATRLCREAPVPIVQVRETIDQPGGAANAAVNLHSLGARVDFLSVVGDDDEGTRLLETLREQGIAIEHVLRSGARRTLTKQRVLAGSQLLLRFDQGSTELLDRRTERRVANCLTRLFADCDAVVVSDYGYGILTPLIIKALAAAARTTPRVLVVDAKDLGAYRAVGATAVKPNYGEVLRLLDEPEADDAGSRAEWIAAQSERLLEATGARIVAATLDTDGAVIVERDRPPYRTYSQPADHTRATGAGDTFVSALALTLAAGAQAPVAAEIAAAAARIVVAKDGTATCSAKELADCFTPMEKYATSLEALRSHVDFHRGQGRRVVFTNGCFDILHRGHITFLNRAKALGHVLIVGINSDSSIARLKGPDRPINSLEDRAGVLAALSCIDHLIAFNEDTPTHLIEAIRPDIFVKGGDYTRETLPEAPLVEALGGEIHILPYLDDHSTSSMIRRIREVAGNPAHAQDLGKPDLDPFEPVGKPDHPTTGAA